MHLPSFIESADRRFLRSIAMWSVSAMFAFSLVVGVVRTTGTLGSFAMRSFAQATSALLPQDENGHINVLLLGVGDKRHSAADLTDSMIVASIDPDTQSVALLSIPRDLYVLDAKGVPDGRINSLYSYYKSAYGKEKDVTESGASVLAMRSLADDIGTRLGTEIHGVLKMDFVGFSDIIDAVGGVDVDVPEKIVDNTYPVKEGVIGTFSIEKGPQHLDGETALQYARSRHSTTDFDRSARQQQILGALGDKVKSLDVLGNGEVIRNVEESVRSHFETTFGRGELFALAGTLVSVRRDRIVSMHLNYETGGDSSDAEAGGFVRSPAPGEFSGAVLFPSSPTGSLSDWSHIRSFAETVFTHRDLYLQRPLLLALDATDAKPLQAHRLRNELLRYGLRIEDVRHDKSLPAESVVELTRTGDKRAAAVIAELIGLPLERVYDEPSSATGASIRIVLGKDYTYSSFAKVQERSKE